MIALVVVILHIYQTAVYMKDKERLIMSDDKTVTITKDEYASLRKDCEKLSMLENYGVDNWEGYSIALWSDGNDFDLVEEKIDKEVEEM